LADTFLVTLTHMLRGVTLILCKRIKDQSQQITLNSLVHKHKKSEFVQHMFL